MAQYMLSVHGNDEKYASISMDAIQQMQADVGAFNQAVMDSGAYVFGGGMQSVTTAKVVVSDGDSVSVTDGPYLSGDESIGGFWVVDVADDAAALELARQASAACQNSVEVRPFQVLPEE